MKDEQLSADFWLREFLVSETASRLGKPIVPMPDEIENLRRLCTEVLQPLRTELGRPIFISSGLRPHWLNKAIGGSGTSMHPYGCAADFRVAGVKNENVCNRVRELNLPVDQCILEFPPEGWVHTGIALPGETPRRMYLTARAEYGATHYLAGIKP